MQFYTIHDNPKINAKLLPNYSIKRVNVREGWQMLSDIGHAYHITWDGQNKEYNRFHPNTWKWWLSPKEFSKFVEYYKECLIEYTYRFNKETIFHERFNCFMKSYATLLSKMYTFNEYTSMMYYLVYRKNSYMSDGELSKLMGIIYLTPLTFLYSFSILII